MKPFKYIFLGEEEADGGGEKAVGLSPNLTFDSLISSRTINAIPFNLAYFALLFGELASLFRFSWFQTT